MPPHGASSVYTMADFVRRLKRSSLDHVAALYHHNRPLFEHRPDVFCHVVGQLSWDRAIVLVRTAAFVQPLPREVYVATLKSLLRGQRNAEHAVPWRAALGLWSMAVTDHGARMPSVATTCALRLLGPTKQWAHASMLLYRAQSLHQLTQRMVLAAVECYSTPSQWRGAFRLLEHTHRSAPQLLPEAVRSLESYAKRAVSTMRHDPVKPKTVAVLRSLQAVLPITPWEVALSNPLCVSYLSLASAYGVHHVAVGGVLPWAAALQLLLFVTNRHAGQLGHGQSPVELAAPDAAGAVVAAATVRDHSARLATVLRGLPSLHDASRLLENVNADRSVHSHHLVSTALLDIAVRSGSWEAAVGIVRALGGEAVISRATASRLVLLLHGKGQAMLCRDVVGPKLIETRSRLTRTAAHALLECAVVAKLPWRESLGLVESLSATVPGATVAGAVELNPRMVYLLVLLCVKGDAPTAALRVLGFARSELGIELSMAKELEALLFCQRYGREHEARLLLEQCERRYGSQLARPLQQLWSERGTTDTGHQP